jgi:thiamine pyrophosphate-dependent acetolactate synthase large subunit-like protein
MAIEERRPWIDWIHTAMAQGNVVRDYVKWDDQVISLPSAIDSILRGYQLSMTEPKGPVYICLDVAVQREKLDKPVVVPDVRRYANPTPVQGDPVALKQAAELLVEARHPVIIADYMGRSPEAFDALIELSELLSVPVVDNGNLFSFPSTHPLDITEAKEEILRQADVVLALGVFDLFQALVTVDRTSGRVEYIMPETATIIDISLRHFDVGSWSQEYGKLQAVDLSISAGTASALPTLISLCREILAQRTVPADQFEERLTRVKLQQDKIRKNWEEQAQRTENETPISVSRLTKELWGAVNEEDWVLTNANYAVYPWIRRLWDLTKSYQYTGGALGGGLGSGIGYSIGVALAHQPQNRLCIDIQPDGDLLFTSSGLWTAVHHRVPLLVIMFNNRSYYNSERHQENVAKARGRPVENRIIGTRIDNPAVDFTKLAQSFGLYTEGPIENPADLRPALENAVKYVKQRRLPALVDVLTQPA